LNIVLSRMVGTAPSGAFAHPTGSARLQSTNLREKTAT
jgi:hypothetical protein